MINFCHCFIYELKDESMNKKPVRWPILATGTIGLVFSGIIYAWSILKAPLQEEFNWNASQMAFNFTLTMCTFCIGGIISGKMLSKISLRAILLIAAVLDFAGFFISSKIDAGGLHVLYISYGGLAGLGIGIAYNAIISVVNEWFPDIKGTASGILMMSFGASALILGNAANSLIKAVGWRNTFLTLGILTAAALSLAAVFMRHTGTENHLEMLDSDHKKNAQGEVRSYTTAEMIRRPTFIRLFCFLVLASAVGNSTISMARDVAMSAGAEAGIAAVLAGVLSLCNGAGRLLAGALFDKAGQRATMTIDGVVTIIAPAVMLIAVALHSVPLVALGLALTGFSYSFQPPVTSSVVASFYGPKYFSINFSVANLTLIPTSFVATIGGMLFTATGSYFMPFLLLLVFALISFMLNLSIRHA